MRRGASTLTQLRVQQLSTPGKYSDGRGTGLYLQVTKSDLTGAVNKSWLLRYAVGQRERWHGLGWFPNTSLAQARERAQAARALLHEGIDPIDQKAAQRIAKAVEQAKAATAQSFEAAAEDYIRRHAPEWRTEKSEKQWRSSLQRFAFPKLGKLPPQSIDVDLVLAVLEPIWLAKPTTARRVRNRIELVLDFVAARHRKAGEAPRENPARWETLKHLLPQHNGKSENFAAMPWKEVGAFLAVLRGTESIAARALEFLVLTSVRSGEVITASWSDINLDERLWIIPADKTKTGREHRVCLSKQAVAVLKAIRKISTADQIFQPMGDHAMLRLAQRLRPG